MIVILITTNFVFAQHQISGVVKDSIGYPIKDVIVKLYTSNDSLFSITNNLGIYRFKGSFTGELQLTYSMLGFTPFSKYITTNNQELYTVVDDVTLTKVAYDIKSVSVTRVVPMVINGDTIQYNLGAFTFRNKTLLEDGLKRIPGFQISRDGSVYFNGTPIKKVRVNNSDFFGGDIITATKNLPVDYINNIQLIEIQNVDSGTETGIQDYQEKEKMLNINLKEDKKILHFGQVTIGSGTNGRYLGSFGINRFNDGNEISLLGSINNTNTNLFSYGDVGGGSRTDRILNMDEYIDPIDGINSTSSVGINIGKKVGKQSRINASYNYLKKYSDISGYSSMKSTYIGNTITKNDNYEEHQEDDLHKIKIQYDGKLQNKDIIKFTGNLSFAEKAILNNKETVLSNFQYINRGTNKDSSRNSTPLADFEFIYAKHFTKKDRKFVGKINSNTHAIKNRQLVDEKFSIYSKTTVDYDDELNFQFINQKNNNANTGISMSFVEPFYDHSVFEFKYEFDYSSLDAQRHVYKGVRTLANTLVDSLTVNYGYTFKSNKLGLLYQFKPNNRVKFNLGFAVQPLNMNGEVLYDTLKYIYENINLVPTSNFSYKLSKNVDFQISYRGKNNQPSFFQLVPIYNNTNSRNIILGNPELKAEFSHNLVTSFRAFIPSRMQFLETNFSYNSVKHKIVTDKKILDNSTIQQTTFRNSNGYYDLKWNYLFNTPFENENWLLDLTGGLDYYNNLSFIEDKERTTKQFIINQSLQLKYSLLDRLESVFSTNYSVNKASYDIPYRTQVNVETLFLGLSTKGYLNNNLSLGFEMFQKYNDGYINKFMNVSQTMMNAFAEFSFLHNRTAMLRLQAFDIFDQNTQMGFYAEYIGNDVFEERKNRLGRYFMLSLNIRMQK